MIRRVLDFAFVLIFVWSCLLLVLWSIDSLIVPLKIPQVMSDMLTGTLKVALSFLLVLLWLWVWREIVERIFWRTVSKEQHFINKSSHNQLSHEKC